MSSLDSRDDMLSVLASVAQRRGEVGSAARLRGVDVDALTERQLARANAVLDKPIVLGYDVPIDSSPMTVTGLAQVSRVHTLFVMLGLKQVLVVDRGVLIGLLTRSSILEGTSI